MTEEQIRNAYSSGKLTWSDLLEITGLHASDLYEVLYDLIKSEPERNGLYFEL